MITYRCYFVGRDGHYRDYASLNAQSDAEAIQLGHEALAVSTFATFELWSGNRRVSVESFELVEPE